MTEDGLNLELTVSDLRTGDQFAAMGPSTPHRCDFYGWSKDDDPVGLNLRAGPGTDAAIVGVLPPVLVPEPGEGSGLFADRRTGFRVLRSRDGWFEIDQVYRYGIDPESGDFTETLDPDLRGWISGAKLGLVVQSNVGFERPDTASVVKFRGSWDALDFVPLRLHDCNGPWADISYDTGLQQGRAWFRGLCGAQETTCDMAMDMWLPEEGADEDKDQ